jgi:acetyl esterase/lipase
VLAAAACGSGAATTSAPPGSWSSPVAPGGIVVDPGPADVAPDRLDPAPTVDVTTSYGTPAQAIDLYLPDGPGPHPVLVWFHAGGWIEGDRSLVPVPILDKVADGWAVASVDYRLAPQVHFPVPVQDAKHAVRYLKAHGSAWDLDTSTIVAAGGSAGGYLAAMVGTSVGDLEPDDLDAAERAVDSTVQGVVVLAGPVDLAAVATSGELGSTCVNDLLECECEAGAPLQQCRPQVAGETNPAAWASRRADAGTRLPPAYLAYGALDTLVTLADNGRPLFDAWTRAAPGCVWLDIVDNQGHNVDVNGVNDTALTTFLDLVRSHRS